MARQPRATCRSGEKGRADVGSRRQATWKRTVGIHPAQTEAMALSGKVKTSLDETRTLMLGAQILLGFQFNGAFRPRFDALPPSAKLRHRCAGAHAGSVGLLIAPSAFHRIVDRGERPAAPRPSPRCAPLRLGSIRRRIGPRYPIASAALCKALLSAYLPEQVSRC